MVGDYEKEEFTDPLRDNALSALATLHSALGLDPSLLKLHKEDPRTTHICPGKNVDKADVIAGISQAMAALTPGDHKPGSAV